MTVLVTLLTVAVAILTLLVLGLLRSHATILRRLHELGAGIEPRSEQSVSLGATEGTQMRDPQGPRTAPGVLSPSAAPAGRPAHDVHGRGPNDEAVAIRVVGARQDTILAFLSTGCETCATFWEQLQDPQLPERTRVVIVTKGVEAESPGEVASLAPPEARVVMSTGAWEAYGVPGSPYVVHVDGEAGVVRGEGTGADWPQVRRMLMQASGDGRGGKAAADARREREIDRTLLAAGIGPGDPSLYRNADQIAPLSQAGSPAGDDAGGGEKG